MDSTDQIIVSRAAAAQLTLHTRLAAHHAALVGAEPAAAEALLAWAVLRASGEAVDDAVDALPTASEMLDDPAALPAYRAAADQAEQLLAHFDDEERFDLADLYGRAVNVIDGEIRRMLLADRRSPDAAHAAAGELTE